MSYIKFCYEASKGRGEDATLEILQTDILIGGEFNVELVDYGMSDPYGSDPFMIVSTSSLFDIEDKEIAEVLSELAIRTRARLYMLITNEDKTKHRYIVAGTKELLVDKYYQGEYDPEQLKESGLKPSEFLSCIHKWDDLTDVNIYYVE